MLTRDLHRALATKSAPLPSAAGGIDLVAGDLTGDLDVAALLDDADAVVLTHGSDGGGTPETVDYGGTVRIVDGARATGRPIRIVYVSTLYVTRPDNPLNAYGHGLDWKFQAEQHVRASGLPYVVVRPGWLSPPDPARPGVTVEQGDTGEGRISHQHVAEVLAAAVHDSAATGRTFEVFDGPGPAVTDWTALFSSLRSDVPT
jgi:uncharacterized protein YbjT (DUF2867 family)